MTLPPIALSVRQPWAWAIIHGGKDIENRVWKPNNPCIRFRGRVAIHASKAMTRQEYEDTSAFLASLDVRCPAAHELKRGGIIGSVEVVDVVTFSTSRWFFGHLGLVLKDPEPCSFVPAKGALGFFNWSRGSDDCEAEPARWMEDV